MAAANLLVWQASNNLSKTRRCWIGMQEMPEFRGPPQRRRAGAIKSGGSSSLEAVITNRPGVVPCPPNPSLARTTDGDASGLLLLGQ